MPSINAVSKEDLNGFKPLPEGDYKLVVVKAKDTTSKAGNPMTSIQCEVQDQKTKRVVFENLTWVENCVQRIQGFWMALGHKVNEGDSIEFEACDLPGSEFEAHLAIDEYKGEKRNKISYYLYPDRDRSRDKGVKKVETNELGEPKDITF